jgi:hypothetical protein
MSPGPAPRGSALLVFGALAAGIGLLRQAMRLYPGGSAAEPTHVGHSFWLNYLCDLTGDVAVNGAPNLRGAALARAAMLLLSIALGLVFLVLPRVLGDGRWSKHVVRIGGALCGLGLIAVPFADGRAHAPTILVTAVAGIAAMATAVTGMWRARRRALLAIAGAALIASTVDAVLYAAKVAGTLPASSAAVPALQRVATLLLLAWMAAVSAAILRDSS